MDNEFYIVMELHAFSCQPADLHCGHEKVDLPIYHAELTRFYASSVLPYRQEVPLIYTSRYP